MHNNELELSERFDLLKHSHDKLLECVAGLMEEQKNHDKRIKLNLSIIEQAEEIIEKIVDLVNGHCERIHSLEELTGINQGK